VQETLGGIRVVKAFGQEDREKERFTGKASETLRARIRLSFHEGGLGLMVGLVIAAGEAGVIFIGVRNVQAGTLTLGDLLLVMGYLSQLYRPLQSISKRVGDLQHSLASAERTFSLLDQTPEVIEKPNAMPLSRASGALSFQNVSFAYDGENNPVLQMISFEVGPGTRVGIAGTTGAGKTTLVSLLTRFYDPTSGRITLDGVDLRDYRIADLRKQFAIVLQEPVLFSTSIAENIAYANPDATFEEIVAAAQAANAHEFISHLPEGYNTQVGERGMLLSGGERQRISLARAFLKDAPILILDEPTSSVDMKTEAVIMEAMTRLMHERTTFMIAHRLSTLANCDVRLQIEGGRVIDSEQQRIMGAGAGGNTAESLHRSKETP
jgi:ATP-binding cassette subfamily B protein